MESFANMTARTLNYCRVALENVGEVRLPYWAGDKFFDQLRKLIEEPDGKYSIRMIPGKPGFCEAYIVKED